MSKTIAKLTIPSAIAFAAGARRTVVDGASWSAPGWRTLRLWPVVVVSTVAALATGAGLRIIVKSAPTGTVRWGALDSIRILILIIALASRARLGVVIDGASPVASRG